MRELLACPFCRELYRAEEGTRCKVCDVDLVPLGSLPLSEDARELEPSTEVVLHPDDQKFPIWHLGHYRGPLFFVSLGGLFAFFLPWLEVSMPDPVAISGFDIARGRSPWFWGGALGWFVLLALLITRRSAYELRGVRVISATFSVLTALEVIMLWLRPPTAGPYVKVLFEWGYGLYLSFALSLASTGLSLLLGGPPPVIANVGPPASTRPAVNRNENPQLH
jgi:hypothetical protein